MQTIEREHTIKALNEGIENGNIVFNHPMQRKPVIKLAREELSWEPTIELEEGLKKTIQYFKTLI